MGSKTITISEDAYKSLRREKLPKESFSDTILRLTKRFGRIMESFGKWDMSEEEIKSFKEDLNKTWTLWSKTLDQKEEE